MWLNVTNLIEKTLMENLFCSARPVESRRVVKVGGKAQDSLVPELVL